MMFGEGYFSASEGLRCLKCAGKEALGADVSRWDSPAALFDLLGILADHSRRLALLEAWARGDGETKEESK